MEIKRNPDLEEVYKIHRAYIEHEDNLINHRTTWMITVQSFLIATFGFSYQKKFEVAEKLHAQKASLSALGPIGTEYNIFLMILAFVGLVTAIAAFFSVYAAVRSLRAVKNNWLRINGYAPPGYLPGATGGGDLKASKYGISLSMWAPIFFSLLWLSAFVFLLFWFSLSSGVR